VIIFGGDGSNGLGIARNLGSRGIDVYCITSNPYALMIHSKYCREFALIPGIEREPDKIKKVLKKLGEKLPNKGVIFPTGDNALLSLSTITHELDNYLTFIPSKTTIETLVIKRKFYRSLEANNVPHPLTLYTDENNVKDIESEISYPVYIRPSVAPIFTKIFGGKGFSAKTPAELRKRLQQVEKHNIDVMIQEIITGPTSNGYTIRGYFDKNSNPLTLIAVQKIRQLSMFADNCVSVSVSLSQVADFCDTIVGHLKSLKYRGLFGAEFKLDPRDDRFKLLEINARSMGGNGIETASGVNNILAAYKDTLGEKVEPIKNYETGVYQISLIMDMATLSGIMNRDRLVPTQSRDIRPYLKRKIWSRLSRDDFVPFIKSIRAYLS
jgi:predicted ATP-grasp superfamily ATP-dependent carboligase